jgi:uncharacterized sporulation protein YeaH/YhbH (DUF444 family)
VINGSLCHEAISSISRRKMMNKNKRLAVAAVAAAIAVLSAGSAHALQLEKLVKNRVDRVEAAQPLQAEVLPKNTLELKKELR